MQLLGILISQLGRIDLLLGSIDSSLSLTDLCLIGLVINDEQSLAGTYRLTFFHINLHQEASYLRTDLNILHTLDGSRISRLHICF